MVLYVPYKWFYTHTNTRVTHTSSIHKHTYSHIRAFIQKKRTRDANFKEWS
jgi:hypothetical protein